MTREETSKYTDLMADGRARLFSLDKDAKSVITFPSGDMRLPGPGIYNITGFAWSGRGRVQSVDVSLDAGKTWYPAHLGSTPEPMCTVRFTFPWTWDATPAVLQSRCVDETGYVQPTRQQLLAIRALSRELKRRSKAACLLFGLCCGGGLLPRVCGLGPKLTQRSTRDQMPIEIEGVVERGIA